MQHFEHHFEIIADTARQIHLGRTALADFSLNLVTANFRSVRHHHRRRRCQVKHLIAIGFQMALNGFLTVPFGNRTSECLIQALCRQFKPGYAIDNA